MGGTLKVLDNWQARNHIRYLECNRMTEKRSVAGGVLPADC
jgi:hypothetical protein